MQDKEDYCEKCGGFIWWDPGSFLMTDPPKMQGRCKDCGNIQTKLATLSQTVEMLDCQVNQVKA